MSTQKSTVYVVEDNPSFRKSVERLIRVSGCDVVSFGSANSFLAQDAIRHPACLLLDVQLPDMDGLLLQQGLMGKGFDLPVIFMTGHGSIPMSVKAMKSGAIDFLSKPFEKKDLLAAIGQALTHDIRRLEEAHEKKEINALLDTLTPREKEVMCFVIAGRLNKQSAHALGIAEKTIKVHRSRVMQKTGVSPVAELVRLAENAGIAPAD